MSAATFFGASIDQVCDCRRRREYCADTERQLEQRLRELRSRRDRLSSQSSAQVPLQAEKIPRTEAKIEEARRAFTELLKEYHRLARIDGSFWIKLGLRTARLFWRKSLPVGELKERLTSLERQLEDAEANLDYLAHVRSQQQRALDRLTDPIEELDEVIVSLQRQLDEAGREGADCDKAILDAVRQVVRSTAADGLNAKLAAIGPRPDYETLVKRVYRLRAILLALDTMDHGEEGELVDIDPRNTEQRIRQAVLDAFVQHANRGISRMQMEGRGTTHVRKSRTRTETVRDSNGRLKTRHRTEHYWDHANVTLAGDLQVPFEIAYRRWHPGPVAEALRDEAATRFALGVQRFRKSAWQKHEDALVRQADACTREIRDLLLREWTP